MAVKALSIGRVTIDRYHRGGQIVHTTPGGSAYNVARWFQDAGLDSSLAATLGEDFPTTIGVDVSPCVYVDSPTFCVDIQLTEESGDESRTENDRGYELQPLEVPDEQYDIVGLFSFENSLLEPFEAVDGRIKVYDPGEMTTDYEWPLIERGVSTANHVFLNVKEKRVLREIAPYPIAELPATYDVETLVVTAEDAVTVYQRSGSQQFPVDPSDTPTDTVGAGDAFASRYVEGLLREDPLQERVLEAIERASATVGHVGSLPARFRSDEVIS